MGGELECLWRDTCKFMFPIISNCKWWGCCLEVSCCLKLFWDSQTKLSLLTADWAQSKARVASQQHHSWKWKFTLRNPSCNCSWRQWLWNSLPLKKSSLKLSPGYLCADMFPPLPYLLPLWALFLIYSQLLPFPLLVKEFTTLLPPSKAVTCRRSNIWVLSRWGRGGKYGFIFSFSIEFETSLSLSSCIIHWIPF